MGWPNFVYLPVRGGLFAKPCGSWQVWISADFCNKKPTCQVQRWRWVLGLLKLDFDVTFGPP